MNSKCDRCATVTASACAGGIKDGERVGITTTVDGQEKERDEHRKVESRDNPWGKDVVSWISYDSIITISVLFAVKFTFIQGEIESQNISTSISASLTDSVP